MLKKLIKKYNEIWGKVKNLFKKEFNSEPVYKDKYIKTKIKIYYNKTNTKFYDNKIPENNEYCACLSVILLDSVYVNANKECYPQEEYLEECKFAIKKKKIMKTINEELKLDKFDDGEFDE